jgi:hypothetical protein
MAWRTRKADNMKIIFLKNEDIEELELLKNEYEFKTDPETGLNIKALFQDLNNEQNRTEDFKQ